MFEWETLKTSQLSHRETARTGGMRRNATAARDCMSEREVTIVARSLELSHRLRVVVCEVARDTTDRLVDGCEFGAMRETRAIFWFAVRRFGEIG